VTSVLADVIEFGEALRNIPHELPKLLTQLKLKIKLHLGYS